MLIAIFAFSTASYAAQVCTTTPIAAGNIDIDGLAGTSDSNIIAVGENGQINIFDGTNWVQQPVITGQDLNDVFVQDGANAVTAIVGENGTVIVDTGSGLTQLSSPTTRDLEAVWAYGPNEIYVAGDDGRIYVWNGTSWTDLRSDAGAGNTDDFVDAWGDANYVYFLADNGRIFRYDRSGNWTTFNSCNIGGGVDFNAFTPDGSGGFYLIGEGSGSNAVIYYWDGASSCTSRLGPNSFDEVNDIAITSTGQIIAVAEDGVVLTSNDGTTWTSTTEGTQDINAVWVSPTDVAYYAVNNGEIKTCVDLGNHFSFTHDGAGNACVSENVVLTAHDSTHGIDTNYTGTVNLTTSTSHGDWSLVSGNGTLTNSGNGAATYTFVAADNGQVTLGFTDGYGETVNFNATDGSQTEFFGEDNSMVITGLAGDYFLDSFANPGFDNNNGTLLWSGNWIEFDPAGSGPNSGNVSTGGGRLRLDDRPDTGAQPSATRQADLSAYTGATLSFDYFTSGGVDSNDVAIAEVSGDGGATWSTVQTFSGLSGSNSGNVVFDISSYIAFNTQIRFRIVSNYGGPNERIEFDNIRIDVATVSICQSIDHFEIRHDGTGLTCENEPVTVNACADAACTSYYTVEDISVTLSPTGWVGGDTQTITNGTGIFNLSHPVLSPVGAASETLTLGITSSAPSATNPVQCFNTATGTNSCDITFYDSGFRYIIDPMTSCQASTITIQAIQRDPGTGLCTTLFDGGVTKNINFSISPAATPQFSINGSPLANAPATTSIPLSFTGGQATFNLLHNDAGQYTLNSSYTEGSLTLTGATQFVVKPHSIYLQATDTSDVDLNGANETATPIWRAGQDFRLRIRGQCQDGTITTNYVPTNAELSVELIRPTAAESGVQGNLRINGTDYTSSFATSWSNISSLFNNGQVTNGTDTFSDASFSEVGIIQLRARDSNYYGTTIAENILSPVGRFTPNHFNTIVTESCGSFTYSGQPFTTIVEARNAFGNITGNYHSTVFAKQVELSNAGVTSNFNPDPTNMASTDFTNGTGTKNDVVYQFANKETPEQSITLRATDTDGIDSTTGTEDTNLIRSGRMVLDNAYGPEQFNLVIPLRTEFYTDAGNGGFITNTDDSCTTYSDTLGILNNYTQNLNAGETSLVIIGTQTVSAGLHTTPLELTAPGTNNFGTVDVTHDLTAQPWLQYDWDNNGTHDNDPTGTASFGLYRGDDRIIFQREVLP